MAENKTKRKSAKDAKGTSKASFFIANTIYRDDPEITANLRKRIKDMDNKKKANLLRKGKKTEPNEIVKKTTESIIEALLEP